MDTEEVQKEVNENLVDKVYDATADEAIIYIDSIGKACKAITKNNIKHIFVHEKFSKML